MQFLGKIEKCFPDWAANKNYYQSAIAHGITRNIKSGISAIPIAPLDRDRLREHNVVQMKQITCFCQVET